VKRICLVFGVVAVLVMPPAVALSGESCANAEKFNGRNVYWNTMCWFDQLIGWE
jgi:hypothetical protein